jgi:predicted ATPase
VRLTAINATSLPPVRRFEVTNLSDVVVIAGQNGVGKSRLVAGILARFQNPGVDPGVQLTFEATCDDERNAWQQPTIDTSNQVELSKLWTTLTSNKNRTQWVSSAIHFESDRSITQIQPYQFQWDATDPYGEMLGWNMTFGGLKARFQDTLHSLFRKVQSNDKDIARRAKELQSAGQTSMQLNFTDPLLAFKEAFSQLVAPKKLLDLDPRDQQLYFEHEGQRLPVSSMSSGEREVVNIVFDFILRSPSDCIIFFDEPEIHLHPELSYRLLQTLKSVGKRNQFFFCTHSPEIITASLENTVVFISPPGKTLDGLDKNQAIVVVENDDTNNALRLLGQSIGIVSLGKKIVLIEGANSSLDKQTYGFILKNRFPNLVTVPSGGREVIESFQQLSDKVLSKTIWGVDFFMICDRDVTDDAVVTKTENLAQGKLRYLKKYHLENYFLDSEALAKVFENFEPEESWLNQPHLIKNALKRYAKETIPYATALIVSAQVRRQVGNVSIMPKGVQDQDVDTLVNFFIDKLNQEVGRINTGLSQVIIEEQIRDTHAKLLIACADENDAWMKIIPGKQILARFASEAKIDIGRLKLAYVKAVQDNSLSTFNDIIEIFGDFSLHDNR